MFGQVAASFELGQDQKDPDQGTKIVAGVLTRLQARPDVELQLGRRVVDLLIAVDHLLAELGVPVQKSPGSAGERLAHEPEKAEDRLFDYLRHGGERYRL